jgi:polyhydroxybutyrate depolymerase
VRRLLVAALVLAVSATALAACGTADTVRRPGDDCVPARSLPQGSTERTIVSGGHRRSYLLHVPPGYDGSTRTPVMVLLHGLGGDPHAVVKTTRMDQLADDRGVIVVAPLGRGRVSHWNFRSPISDPQSDLAFVRDLVKRVRTDGCVDSSRLFAAGFSNGSALTLALACDGTTPFAAYGAVSGPYWGAGCRTAPPASLIYFHGMADKVVAYGGARTVIGPLPPVNQVMSHWATHDSCPPASATTTVSDHVRHYAWTGCRKGSAVSVYVIENGGHRWPGGTPVVSGRVSGVMTQEINATDLIWQFFEQHAVGGQ